MGFGGKSGAHLRNMRLLALENRQKIGLLFIERNAGIA